MREPARQSLVVLSFIIVLIVEFSQNCPAQDAPQQRNQISASPTFVDAKNDPQRCQAIAAWFSSIRADAMKQVADGDAPAWWVTNGTLHRQLIEDSDWILEFATHSFRRNIGKRLPDMSNKEMERLSALLTRCPDQTAINQKMSSLFYYSDSIDRWRSRFDDLERKFDSYKQERRKVLELESAKETVRTTGYQIGALLKETETYSLYKSAYRRSSDWSVPFDWCNQYDNHAAMVGLLFKDGNAVVDDSPAYWSRFEAEMLPVITDRCPGIDRVYVANYVRGYQIHYERLRIDRYVDSNTPSEALSSGIYRLDSTATPKYFWFYGVGSGDLFDRVQVAGSGRSEIEVRGKGRDSRLADSSLISIARLQTVFKAVSDKETAETQRELDRRAQQQRERAEAAKQAKIPNDRRLAATTLSTVKKGAREHYDFAGYAYQDSWQNVYNGNFDYFTGGYASAKDLDMEMLTTVFTGGPYTGLLNAGAKGAPIGLRRHFLNMAFYAYNNTYAQRCGNNKEFPWVKSNPGVFSSTLITKRGGYEVSRSTVNKEGISHVVREPFVGTYNSAYLGVANYNNVDPGMPQELLDDLSKMLNAEGCTSPSLRQFEVNLALARDWLLPLQLLRTTEEKSEPTVDKAKPSSTSRKQKTVSKPPTRRVRPRG